MNVNGKPFFLDLWPRFPVIPEESNFDYHSEKKKKKNVFCFRYTFFIVLYPMGVTGELLTIYAALPHVQKTGLYSVTLPNKYNFSFDYYTFLIVVMVSYIPRKSSRKCYVRSFFLSVRRS